MKRFSLQNREKSCSLRVKPGIPVPVDVIPVPDPTRTRGYGSGRVYPRVRVDPAHLYLVPRPLCSRLRRAVRDRRQTASSLYVPAY